MTIKTKDLIKLLSIDQVQKQALLASFDTLEQPSKSEVVDLLWHTFDNIYNAQLQKNIDEGIKKSC